MTVTKKIVDEAVRGIPESGGQRRNVVGQFHGPKTAVPAMDQAEVPSLACLDPADEEGGLLGGIDNPLLPSADDGCEDGKGDF
jgi:hypothetical protein